MPVYWLEPPSYSGRRSPLGVQPLIVGGGRDGNNRGASLIAPQWLVTADHTKGGEVDAGQLHRRDRVHRLDQQRTGK
ncbi:hypothetical protein BS329_27890 [Amycolatopsis coloradensis]|uniref:Peptidase S1 domain-containing protein n=1 Tax=Amycolatopsis coloradensis TaxID=76021 RepID=A0A1R0KLY5_9PSEU|nr:hypothetical protein BS329_27890 [Amycolatopsis coloradensis]